MAITAMNFRGKGLPYAVEDILDKLVAEVNRLGAENAALRANLTKRPPLTLREISHGLSAQGAAPLNLTGLPGK